jgi:hypothetical protein
MTIRRRIAIAVAALGFAARLVLEILSGHPVPAHLGGRPAR